jgi:hypothetical protein
MLLLQNLIKLITLFILVFLFSCENDDKKDDDKKDDEEKFEIIMAERCSGKNYSIFDEGKKLNEVKSPPLDEISGMVASINNPGYYWVHNDSGGEAAVFLVDGNGKYITRRTLNTSNNDWEDIACVKSPFDGKSYLFIGDFGDNNARLSQIRVIMIEEPKIDFTKEIKDETITGHKNIMLKYPTGAVDSETLIVDPINLDLYIITKRETFSRVMLAEYPYDGFPNILEHVGTLPYGNMTGGDISPDGSEILIRNYGEAFYWQRVKDKPLKYTFLNSPECLELIPEPKGESICFSLDSKSFFTVSEVKGYENIQITFNKYDKR